MKKLKKRKAQNNQFKVEIYFILYLAALVLLLPDRVDEVFVKSSKYYDEANFQLALEKSVMNLRILKKDKENKIINFDSINTIYFSGDFDNVSFNYILEDSESGEALRIKNNNLSNKFQINEDFEKNRIIFNWLPNFKESYNSSYTFKIEATFEKGNLSQTHNVLFTLNTFFLNEQIDSDILTNDNTEVDSFNQSNQTQNDFTYLGEPNLILGNNIIRHFAGKKWHQQITALNLDLPTDINTPEIKITKLNDASGGTAFIDSLSRSTNSIYLSGETPFSGRIKVSLKVTRKIDNKYTEVDFSVIPTIRPRPSFEKIMYINHTYNIKPNIENDLNHNYLIKLVDKSGKVLYSQNNTSEFTFTPEAVLINTDIRLEILADGEQIESEKIRISKIPDPEILNISVDNNIIIIKTKVFNYDVNKRNAIRKIINNKNLIFEEQIGKKVLSNSNLIQTFIARTDDKISAIKLKLQDESDKLFDEKIINLER